MYPRHRRQAVGMFHSIDVYMVGRPKHHQNIIYCFLPGRIVRSSYSLIIPQILAAEILKIIANSVCLIAPVANKILILAISISVIFLIFHSHLIPASNNPTLSYLGESLTTLPFLDMPVLYHYATQYRKCVRRYPQLHHVRILVSFYSYIDTVIPRWQLMQLQFW
jgi:hypothetical protein